MIIRKQKASNPIRAPRIREVDTERESILEVLYGIKKTVAIVICYDRQGPPVLIVSDRSDKLLNELFEAAKHKATIIDLHINDSPASASSIARINMFVSQPGWATTKTFRGWRRVLKADKTGNGIWNTKHAWNQFEQIINVITGNPQSPVKV